MYEKYALIPEPAGRSPRETFKPKRILAITLAFLAFAGISYHAGGFFWKNSGETLSTFSNKLSVLSDAEMAQFERARKTWTTKFDDAILYLFGVREPEYPVCANNVCKNRVPKDAKVLSVDFLGHKTVQKNLLGKKKDLYPGLYEMCSGPSNMMDIWVNEDLILNDLMIDPRESYTAFGLDCRKPKGHYSFLVVIDTHGNIINVRPMYRRSESINFYNTTTILAAAQNGIYLWDFMTDTLEKLDFMADTHSIMHRFSDNRFYGCYPDTKAVMQHDPNTLCSYDGTTHKSVFDGDKTGFSWSDVDAHFNYLTLNKNELFVSERTKSALKKVNMDTRETEWVLGGMANDFTLIDATGRQYPKYEEFVYEDYPWVHQHKFQHLDDQYFSLLDNNIGVEHYAFPQRWWGRDSRMVILYVDQEKKISREVFHYPMGDLSRSYGGTDVLPSGNVLGSSYVEWVHPTDPDHQYHENIWEVSPDGEVVWRVGFRGLNIANPENTRDPYPRYYQDMSEKDWERHPIGWNIYNVERGYPKPIITKPCRLAVNGGWAMWFVPFNTIRTQEDLPGVVGLYNAYTGDKILESKIAFHKSFLPRPQVFQVPQEQWNYPLKVVVLNHWGEYSNNELGYLSEMPQCPDHDPYRRFYPKQ